MRVSGKYLHRHLHSELFHQLRAGGFVRPLAERLREQHVEVWYDEFSLNVGDSLRRSIDRGLSQSRFGIVVLSPSFFAKRWPQWELGGFVARQNSGDDDGILLVWHGVQRADVLAYSPPLADKLAVAGGVGLDEVIRRLVAVIRPRGSTLVIARDHLLEWGCSSPVISDDWWLDAAAAAESNDMEGGFQEPMGWECWGFPLPPPAKESAQHALTTDRRPPGCDDEYVLRDPEFGRYEAERVACGFVQGNYVAKGQYYLNYSLS